MDDIVKRIAEARPTGALALATEYISRFAIDPDVPDVSRMLIYEAEWGFVTESPAPFMSWSFYSAEVWRRGTEKFYDRFLTAWKNDVAPEVERVFEASNRTLLITMDDGISSHACLSLACFAEPNVQAKARRWIAEEFVGKHWPLLLERVLNPAHRFPIEWRAV